MAHIVKRRLPVFSTFIKTLFDDTTAGGALTTLGVSSFIQTVLDDTTNTAALTTLGIVTGSYTPTLTNTTNLDGSTAGVTNYARINNFVTVWGNVGIDPTTTGAATRLGMSLPIASNFAATTDLGGSMGTSGATGAGRIFADTGNDRADFSFIAPFNVSGSAGFSFGYFVI